MNTRNWRKKIPKISLTLLTIIFALLVLYGLYRPKISVIKYKETKPSTCEKNISNPEYTKVFSKCLNNMISNNKKYVSIFENYDACTITVSKMDNPPPKEIKQTYNCVVETGRSTVVYYLSLYPIKEQNYKLIQFTR